MTKKETLQEAVKDLYRTWLETSLYRPNRGDFTLDQILDNQATKVIHEVKQTLAREKQAIVDKMAKAALE